MSTSIGVRELRNHLSATIRRVRNGEVVRVTDHGREVAMIVPAGGLDDAERFMQLVELGHIDWPAGLAARARGSDPPKPVPVEGGPAFSGSPFSDAIVDERRW